MALTIRPADIIKAKVIDYLIKSFEGVVIGDEIMYGINRKIVDLLALHEGETFAIEIKSSKDDLRRLPEQIADYSKIFDHTLVFTTKEHLSKISELAKAKVSVFEVSEVGGIEGSILNHTNKPTKSEMLATIKSSYIRKRLNISNAKDSDAVRKKAMKYSKDEIHALLYGYFMDKLYAPYELFLKERKDRTEIDDINLLSNRLNVE